MQGILDLMEGRVRRAKKERTSLRLDRTHAPCVWLERTPPQVAPSRPLRRGCPLLTWALQLRQPSSLCAQAVQRTRSRTPGAKAPPTAHATRASPTALPHVLRARWAHTKSRKATAPARSAQQTPRRCTRRAPRSSSAFAAQATTGISVELVTFALRITGATKLSGIFARTFPRRRQGATRSWIARVRWVASQTSARATDAPWTTTVWMASSMRAQRTPIPVVLLFALRGCCAMPGLTSGVLFPEHGSFLQTNCTCWPWLSGPPGQLRSACFRVFLEVRY